MPESRIAIVGFVIRRFRSLARFEVHIHHALTDLAVHVERLGRHDRRRVIRIFQRVISVAVFNFYRRVYMVRAGHISFRIGVCILRIVFYAVRRDLNPLVPVRLQQPFVLNAVHQVPAGVVNRLRPVVNFIVSAVRLYLNRARRDRIAGHRMIADDHALRRGIESIIAGEFRLDARYRIIDRTVPLAGVLICVRAGSFVHDLDILAADRHVELQALVPLFGLRIVFIERRPVQRGGAVVFFHRVIFLLMDVRRNNSEGLDLALVRRLCEVKRIGDGIVLRDLLFRRGAVIRHMLESVCQSLIFDRLMPGVRIRGKRILRAFAVLTVDLIQRAGGKRKRLPIHPGQRHTARNIRLMNGRRIIKVSLGFANIRRHDCLVDCPGSRKLRDRRAMLVNQLKRVILIDLAVPGQRHRIVNGFIVPGVFVRIYGGHRIARAVLIGQEPRDGDVFLHIARRLHDSRRRIIRLGDGGIFLHHRLNRFRRDSARSALRKRTIRLVNAVQTGNIVIILIDADRIIDPLAGSRVLILILCAFNRINQIGHSAVELDVVYTRLSIIDRRRRIVLFRDGIK